MRFQPQNKEELQIVAEETLIWIKNNKAASLENIIERNKKIEEILQKICKISFE